MMGQRTPTAPCSSTVSSACNSSSSPMPPWSCPSRSGPRRSSTRRSPVRPSRYSARFSLDAAVAGRAYARGATPDATPTSRAGDVMLTPERGHYVEVLGLRTFYLQAGAGQPVVLLHGSSPGACSLIHWKHNLDALVEAGFAVYAYDQPGFGYSDNPTDYSMDATVAHARAFMAAFNLTGCHLVGSSLGSEIAVRVALADPGVGRLVLAAASTIAPLGSPASAERAQHHGRELREFVPGLENMRRLSLGTLYNPALVTQELVQVRHEMSIGK